MPEAELAHTVTRAPSLDDVVDAVRDAAAAFGDEVYLVGGFVRDRLRGTPGKDLDLVSVASDGIDVLAQVARRFGWAPPQRFERFGTGQIRGDGFVVEVVRARAERYDPESRKPDVRPGTLEEDVRRRDFTVNALCQTLDGRIIDITGRGLDDLRSSVLRTPLDPADTFSEDPLRMLRGARFVGQLGFALEPSALEAMRREAGRVAILSVERVSEELRRLLVSAHPLAGFDVLRTTGLLDRILPEVMAMIGVEQGGYHTHDVYEHTLRAVEHAPRDIVTRTATLLHDVGKPPTHAVTPDGKHTFYNHPQIGADMARDILTRLRFSNDEIDAVALLVRLHLRPIQYEREAFSDAAVRRLIRDAGALRQRMLDIARADTVASAYPTTAELDQLEERMAHLDAGGVVSRMQDPLDGEEIMELLHLKAGPQVGAAKRRLRDAVLDGELAPGDADAARSWLLDRKDTFERGSTSAR
ncbi:MAG: HD domain-containing protein [Candidatus Dormibacteraeota bacterium]|nr:HD domain-containing protein [Candidatus Dormibacteraeota bacterium]